MAQIKTNLQYGVTGSLQTANIGNNQITNALMADDAIGLAEMAGGTDGNIITYDASGNPAVVSTGTSGHFLKSQGAGSVPVFAAAGGGKLLQVVNTSQASSSGSTARTVISQAITLASASNKCLVSVTFTVLRNSGSTTAYGGFYITGGGLGATTSGMIFSAAPLYTLGVGARVGWAATKLDASPGSTTPTYGLYFGGSADFNFAHSQITVMEIG